MNAYVQALESIASSYHHNADVPDKFIEDLCQEYCCKWLSTLISPTDSVIELGVGEGITVDRLSSRAQDYCVVEGAPSLVEKARKRHPHIEVVNALFEEYIPKTPCDKLLALHVFEHVDNPATLAKHLHRWIKLDGEMVVIVPNRDSLHRRLAVLMGLQPTLDTLSPRDHMVGHQRVYNIDSLHQDLRQGGFEPLETCGFFLKTLPNSMMLDHSSALINALNVLGDSLPPEYQANIAVRARPV